MNAAEPQYDDPSAPAFDDGQGNGWEAVSPGGAVPVHREGDILAGRYQLLSRLGEGGMGSVWRAKSLVLQVDVAVKVVKRGTSSPQACARLLREARAAASLAHPSIVRVLDFGVTGDGEPFLVMELLRGKTLGALLDEEGRLPATTAVELLLPIAAALADVHDLGILHRDIKPENIFLEEGPGGRRIPKLVDFGLAKQCGGDQRDFTQSGVLMGSPAYMSPEQARGSPDEQSDIWSLCVVLYELITGRRPFEGPNHGAVLFAVFADSPLPTHTQAAGDEALWEILRRGLAKARSDRWPSMRQLGRALAAWAVAHDVTADAAGTSLTHFWLGGPGERVDANLPTTPVPRRSRRSEPTDPACRGQAISSRPRDDTSLDAAPPRRLRPVFAVGVLVAVVVAIVTFRALSPTPRAVAGASDAGPPPPSGLAVTTAAEPPAPPPAPAPAAAPDVPDAAAGPTATATASAARPAATREVVRPVPPARTSVPRRPTPPRPLPLPLRPDF